MSIRLVLAFLALVGVERLVGAETTGSPEPAELVRQLVARIEQLEKRVNELEGNKVTTVSLARPPGAALAPAVSALTPVESMHQAHEVKLDPSEDALTAPSLKLAGFSDIDFSASDQHGAKSGFNEGQFILHFNSALSQKVTFLGEVSLTARNDAGTGSPSAPGFNVEVERSIIRFEQNDHLKVSFGRYHTPINYWNTEFHHGSWLQTTVSRPEMTQFGGSFIPVHFVGTLVEGVVPAGGLNLNYNSGFGNGRGAVISRSGDFGDVNNNRAWLAGVFIKPDHPYGLQVGGSVYRDKITPLAGKEVREWIRSAHIVWQKENPELIAEFANVAHRPIGGNGVSNSQSWYVQAAYRLPWFERLWKPYYRFEYIHVPKSDALFRGVPSLAGSVVGMRYDISSFAALKFEYRNQLRPGLPRINAGFAQTSFTF